MKTLDLAAAKQKAYRLLSMRPHSERELAKKLKDKGFEPHVIHEALEKLRDLKYLNDASFAVQWARNLAVNKLWGNRKISGSLQEKGVPPFLIDDAIAAARQEITEEVAVLRQVRKKTASLDGQPTAKDKQRILQSLVGRGFPPGLILNILGRNMEDEFHDDDR